MAEAMGTSGQELFGAGNWDLGNDNDILPSEFDEELFGDSASFQLGSLPRGNGFRQMSQSPVLHEALDDRQVVEAAAEAAGLSRGGLRRVAFSMNDMAALVPSSPDHSSMRSKGSPPMVKLEEGVELGSISENMMGVGSGDSSGSSADRLNGMSINELEEELVRSRNQMASYGMEGRNGGGGAGASSFGSGGKGGVLASVDEAGGGWDVSGGDVSSPMLGMSPTVRSGGDGGIFGGGFSMGDDDLDPVSLGAPPKGMRSMRRAQSTGDLSSLAGGSATSQQQRGSNMDRLDLFSMDDSGMNVGTSGMRGGSEYRIGKYTLEERRNKILRYRQKRHERNFNKKIKYACRKTLADSRPRIRGRFAKNEEWDEMKRAAGLLPPLEGDAAGGGGARTLSGSGSGTTGDSGDDGGGLHDTSGMQVGMGM